MARSAESTLPFRGPFGGLWEGAPQQCPQAPLIRCLSCNNIETSQGDIRRRRGVALRTRAVSAGRIGQGLRGMAFDWGSPATPCMAWLYPVNGTMQLVIVGGMADPALFQRTFTGETVGLETHYHIGMAKLGTTLFVFRPRTEAAPRIVNAAWAEYPLWLAAPTFANAVPSAAAGYLWPGTYRFAATFVNSQTGAESPASLTLGLATSGIALTAPNNTLTVTIGPAVTAGIDRVRLYGQLQGTDTQWYLIGEANRGATCTVFVVIVWVPDRTQANTLDPLSSYQPGPGRDLAVWQRRLWLVAAPNTIACSDEDKYHAFRLENTWAAGPDASDEICRLIPTSTALYVFKSKSLYVVSGTGPDNYTVQAVAEDLELGSPHAIAVVQDTVFAALTRGLYAFDTSGAVCLSDEIVERWGRFGTLHKRTLAWDPERGFLIVQGLDYTGSPVTLVCEPKSRQWWSWTWPGGAPAVVATGQLAVNDPLRVIILLAEGGATYPYGASLYLRLSRDVDQSDDGGAVSWSWTGGILDFGTDWRKQLWGATLLWDASTAKSGDTLAFTRRVDEGSNPVTFTASLYGRTPGRAQFPIGVRCRRLVVALSGTGTGRTRALGYELQASGEGRT